MSRPVCESGEVTPSKATLITLVAWPGCENLNGQVGLDWDGITAVNSITGNQTTQYIYGTTLSDSDIASSLLKRKEIYPDSADSDDEIRFKYNRQGEVKEVRDQNGTVHAFDFDKLGRPTQDRATTLGTGVDGGVRRIATSYEVRGMRQKITSWNSETVGSGSVVNEVQFAYSNFAQVTHDYQAHAGAVNTSTTPKVQYGYANGSANTVRPTTLTYPDGRVLTYSYGSADSMPDALSRVASIVDDDAGSTHLADYSYLGLGTFVEVDYTEPDIEYTLVGTAGGNDPDTGDIYRGFDRFGRVKDSYWYDYGSSSDVDRIKYGYDRNGSRLYRENTVATANNAYFDEKYLYDLIDRLKHMDRGRLTAQKDGVTDKTFAQCWTLDATGNWRKFLEDSDGDGSWSLDQTRTANKVNEITDLTESIGPSWVTPVYSRAGNMTTIPKPADPTASYTGTYDAWNRLLRIEDGSDKVAEYEYDGAKRRTVKKTYVSGVLDETRHFYYTEPSKWQVVEARVESSLDAERHFVWGLRHVDDIVLRDRDINSDGTLDERFYGMQDANWNVTSVSNANGSIQERYNYDAYGSSTALTPTFAYRGASSFDCETRYAGYYFDSGSGLLVARHRYLHSSLSWLHRDPLRFIDGSNLYEYVRSGPPTRVDPSGRACIECRCKAKKGHLRRYYWIQTNCTGLGSNCCEAACPHGWDGDWRHPCDAPPPPPPPDPCEGNWKDYDFANCWACCVKQYEAGAVITTIGVGIGARWPKRFPRPGKPWSKSIWSMKCCRNATGLTIKGGILVGRIGTGLILIEGVYDIGVICTCAAVCGAD